MKQVTSNVASAKTAGKLTSACACSGACLPASARIGLQLKLSHLRLQQLATRETKNWYTIHYFHYHLLLVQQRHTPSTIQGAAHDSNTCLATTNETQAIRCPHTCTDQHTEDLFFRVHTFLASLSSQSSFLASPETQAQGQTGRRVRATCNE